MPVDLEGLPRPRINLPDPPYETRIMQNGAFRAINPRTGRAFRCRKCRSHWATNALGYCPNCVLCNFCMRKEHKDDGTWRCVDCRCKDCGQVSPTLQWQVIPLKPDEEPVAPLLPRYDRWGNLERVRPTTQKVLLCTRCARKRGIQKPDMCGRCHARRPDYFLRGQKKPSRCSNCIGRLGPQHKNVHYCSFCPNKADGVAHLYVACRDCRTKTCCWDRGCTPAKQCKNCTAEQKIRDQQQGALVADAERMRNHPVVMRNQGHYHQSDISRPGHCVPHCAACVAAVAYIWLEKPVEQKFFPAISPAERRVNKSRRFIGVELEVCGLTKTAHLPLVRSTVAKQGGAIVRDGSLPAGGFEINMSPFAGDHYLRAVKEITDALEKAGAWVNTSYDPYTPQAGMHVHIDVRDHTYADMKKLLLLYSVIEPALLRTQPYSRVMVGQDDGHGRNRRYCVPCGERYRNGIVGMAQPKDKYKTEVKKQILTNVYAGAYEQPPRRENHPANARDVHYFALNVHSWFYRGTIECRLHTGTIDPLEITAWGMLWANIVDSSYRMHEKDVLAMKESLPTLLSLCPDEVVRKYINSRYKKYSAEYERA